jgi:hypothetical protein
MSSNTCTSGSCSGTCASGFANCDSNFRSNGCEINTNTNPGNCGGCNAACPGTNMASNTCTSGNCSGTCLSGFADCNSNLRTDGCEINTNTNASNCGGCSAACSPNGVQFTQCTGGACTSPCAANFYDLDNNLRSDGCECYAPTNNCGGREQIGSIAFNTSVVRSGAVPGNLGVYFYDVLWTNSSATPTPGYHPHVILTGTGAVLDIFTYDCNLTGSYTCSEGGSALGITEWEVKQTAGDINNGSFTWASPPPSTHVLVRVRATTATTCGTYSLTFQNY